MTEMQTRQLPVKLTNEEKIAKGLEQTRLRDAIKEVKAAKKAAAKTFAARLAELEADRDRVSDDIRDGTELRAVEVREERNYRQGTLRLVRTDTGEVIETRAMTAAEREEAQVTMFPGGGAKRIDGETDDLRTRIVAFLRTLDTPASKRFICAEVRGAHAVIRATVDELVREGVVTETPDGFAIASTTATETGDATH